MAEGVKWQWLGQGRTKTSLGNYPAVSK